MARIIVKDGTSERAVELVDAITVAGRSTENKIHIEDKQSSRKHCQFEKTDFGYKLVDLESRNGTRVNDKIVNQALLRPGDRVEIGKHVLVFEDPSFKEPPAEVAARFAPPPPAPAAPAPSPAPAAPDVASAPAPAEPRLRRRTGHTTAIERAARIEVAREKSLLTKFGIGVGLFLFIVIVLIMLPSGTPDSKDLRKAREDLAKGQKFYDDRQFPFALSVLEQIPPAQAEPYSKAQAIIRQIRAEQTKLSTPATEEEKRMFDDLYTFCEKSRANPGAAEQIFQRCTAFKSKFPRSGFMPTVDEYIKMANDNRRSKSVTEVGETERLAQEDAKRNEYAAAVRRLNAFLAKPGDDIELRQRIVALHQQTLERAKAWFTAEAAKADGHKRAGRRDEATRVYEALIIAMGDGTVDELADYCTLARTSLKGLK